MKKIIMKKAVRASRERPKKRTINYAPTIGTAVMTSFVLLADPNC
jgi:hypothetical protein